MIVVGSTAPSLGRIRGMGDVADDTWPTTGAIDTETESLALSISQLGADIFNSDTPDSAANASLYNAWNTFVNDFSQWKDSAWFWNPSRRDELVAFRARYNALLAQWQGANGGVTTAAAPIPNDKPPAGPLDQALSIAGDVIVVAAIGAAAWVGLKLYREFNS